MTDMKVVVLCGGQGTRLYGETKSTPKPLVAVGPHPILWHIMKLFGTQGFDEFVLCLGYKSTSIKDYFLRLYDQRSGDFRLRGSSTIEALKPPDDPWDIIFAETGEHTDTGGRLHRVRDHVGAKTFMLTYADGLADIDLGALLRFHRAHKKLATVTVTRPRVSFGVIDTDSEGKVTHFVEKPRLDKYVNSGFFVFEPEVFELTTPNCNLERDVLPKLVEAGELHAYRNEGFWACMDTHKDHIELNKIWASGEAPWKTWS